jgi:hypothetical protein
MAAVLATALSFGSVFADRSDIAVAPARTLPSRMICRWVTDPESGQLVCLWDPEEESRRRPILHLKLVRA